SEPFDGPRRRRSNAHFMVDLNNDLLLRHCGSRKRDRRRYAQYQSQLFVHLFPPQKCKMSASPRGEAQFFLFVLTYLMPEMLAVMARGSRRGQRPASTCVTRRSSRPLKMSGSSRFTVWPVLGT